MCYKVAVYSFTAKGQELAKTIATFEFYFRGLPVKYDINDRFKDSDFEENDALIFIGALGIAVRKIAHCVKSKLTDPAVIVIDEHARNVISVLSGHIGGANELTRLFAEKLSASAVITTATDISRLPAIDEIAANNMFTCCSSDGIVKVNSRILEGECISVCVDETVEIVNINEHFRLVSYDKDKARNADIIISSDKDDIERCDLHILNKCYVLGVGCRKNIDDSLFEKTVFEALNGVVDLSDILSIASIDLKKDEKAITSFSEKYNIPFVTYSADELSRLDGDFEESDFVLKTTGVSNVSERAAAFDESNVMKGSFIIKQIKKDGITLSLYRRTRRFDFNG